MTRTPRALSAALSSLLPDATGTLLLQSCLADGALCASAWTEFQRQERGLTELFRTDRGELKRLGPLLLDNLRRNGIEVEARLATVLRTGALREELRTRICRATLEEMLARLRSLGIESILLGGTALAEWAYHAPWLRHSHDIDLQIPAGDTDRVVTALLAGEFLRAEADAGRDGAVVVTHRNSLPVRLCRSMYELAPDQGSFDVARNWSRDLMVGEAGGLALAPEAALAYALARAAFSPRRASLQWACDGWMICARSESLQAERLVEVATRSRLLLPVAVMLDYLARIGAPIAPALVQAVSGAADGTSPLERDLALFGLRRGLVGGVRQMVRRMPDLSTRLALLRWLSFPSPAYLRWSRAPGDQLPIPALYVARAGAVLRDVARMTFRTRRPNISVPLEAESPHV